MSSLTAEEFVQTFHKISLKLKKRILRKPSYAEAAVEFRELYLAMKREDCEPYAAFCAMALGKCEQALQHMVHASIAFEDAALLFWNDELTLARVGAYSFKELVPLALQCYQFAIDIHSKEGNKALVAGLNFDAGSKLKELGMFEDAVRYFERASSLVETERPFSALTYLQPCWECCVMAGEYEKASETLDRIISFATQLLGSSFGGGDARNAAYCENVRFRARVTQLLLMVHRREMERADTLCGVLQTTARSQTDKLLCYALQDFLAAVNSRFVVGMEATREDMLQLLTNDEYRLFSFVVEDLVRSWLLLAATPAEALSTNLYNAMGYGESADDEPVAAAAAAAGAAPAATGSGRKPGVKS